MFVALLHTVVLGAALRVEGETSCPAPAQVAADAQKILGLSDEYASKVHASLTRDGAFIDLKLTESDGTSLGERRLEANEDCVVLSRTAAVVLAAWLTDQHPEFLVALPASPELGAQPNAAPGASAVPGDRSAPTAIPATAPAPPPSVTERAGAAASAEPKAHSAWTDRLALGAAIGGDWASSQFVPAAWLGVSLDPATTGWGAQVSAAWLGARDRSLQGKEVRWTRWPLMAGPYARFAIGTASVELEVGPALGWLRLKGQEFTTDKAHSGISVGGYGALRFMLKAGAWHPFVMAAPVLWLGHATAYVDNLDGTSASTQLPSLELLFVGGVRFLP